MRNLLSARGLPVAQDYPLPQFEVTNAVDQADNSAKTPKPLINCTKLMQLAALPIVDEDSVL